MKGLHGLLRQILQLSGYTGESRAEPAAARLRATPGLPQNQNIDSEATETVFLGNRDRTCTTEQRNRARLDYVNEYEGGGGWGGGGGGTRLDALHAKACKGGLEPLVVQAKLEQELLHTVCHSILLPLLLWGLGGVLLLAFLALLAGACLAASHRLCGWLRHRWPGAKLA